MWCLVHRKSDSLISYFHHSHLILSLHVPHTKPFSSFYWHGGKLEKQKTSGGRDEAMDSGGVFMSPHGSKGWAREMSVKAHTHTQAQRPVFMAERNWPVNLKFLRNAGCQLKGGGGNVEKANCSPCLMSSPLKGAGTSTQPSVDAEIWGSWFPESCSVLLNNWRSWKQNNKNTSEKA